MKVKITLFLLVISIAIFSQEEKSPIQLLKENTSNYICKCIDSIKIDNEKKIIFNNIKKCIDEKADTYQTMIKLLNVNIIKQKSDTTITINNNTNSNEYKKYYYELENYLLQNCGSLKALVATNDDASVNSYSFNSDAGEWYDKGLHAVKLGKYKKSIVYFKKALKIDPIFAFAWDNLGLSYRQIGKYDKAIEAYKKSIAIDSESVFPIQNLAVAYIFNENYEAAVKTYKTLAKLDENNPEIYYGLGVVYLNNLQDTERSLINMCKAYNLYLNQNSPYRSDAEKVISIIFQKMKEEGKERKFNKILKQNRINY